VWTADYSTCLFSVVQLGWLQRLLLLLLSNLVPSL